MEKFAHFDFRKQRINNRGSGAGTEFFHISAAEALDWAHDQLLSKTVLNGGKRKASVTGTKIRGNPQTHKRKRSSSLEAKVKEFVETHLIYETDHSISTKLIQDSFIEKYHIDILTLPESSFQRILKRCVSARFYNGGDVPMSRTMQAGERVRGYIAINIKPT